MQYGVMIFIVSILVKTQLNDILQLQRLPRDRMLLEFLNIWYNVCDVIYRAIGCTCLQKTCNRCHRSA